MCRPSLRRCAGLSHTAHGSLKWLCRSGWHPRLCQVRTIMHPLCRWLSPARQSGQALHKAAAPAAAERTGKATQCFLCSRGKSEILPLGWCRALRLNKGSRARADRCTLSIPHEDTSGPAKPLVGTQSHEAPQSPPHLAHLAVSLTGDQTAPEQSQRGEVAALCAQAPWPCVQLPADCHVEEGPVSLARLYFELPALIFPVFWDVIKLLSKDF